MGGCQAGSVCQPGSSKCIYVVGQPAGASTLQQAEQHAHAPTAVGHLPAFDNPRSPFKAEQAWCHHSCRSAPAVACTILQQAPAACLPALPHTSLCTPTPAGNAYITGQKQPPAAARQKDKFVPLSQPAAAAAKAAAAAAAQAAEAADGGGSSSSQQGPWVASGVPSRGLTYAQRGGGVDAEAYSR